LRGRGAQIPAAHDVVAREDLRCLVSGEFHRHALRDTAPHHVPHGRPAEVVRDTARTATHAAFQALVNALIGRGSRFTAALADHPKEHPRHDVPRLLPPRAFLEPVDPDAPLSMRVRPRSERGSIYSARMSGAA
jgi:hypothetical protein